MEEELLEKILKNSKDKDLIHKAFEFAKISHQSQKRFSGEDYICHPLAVASNLSELSLDPKTIAASLLHDVVDDCNVSLEDIKNKFGSEIAFLVQGVSKLGKLRYPKEPLKIQPIEERVKKPLDLQAENLRKMFFAMAEDIRVILIKLADRLHNIQTLNYVAKEKQKRLAVETLEVFVPVAERLGLWELKSLLEDLVFPYIYPKEYNWVVENVKEKIEERKEYLQKIQLILKEILEKEGIKVIDIHCRAKSYWSLYQKLLKHKMNLERIYDLVALRVIVEDVKTCYQVLGVVHQYWRPLPGRIKDYIAFPKPNGYKSLHTTVFAEGGRITEIQIRTPQMHEDAQYGICAHWAVKEKIDLINKERKFAWVKQLNDWQKEISGTKEFLDGLKFDFFKNRIFVFTPKGDIIDLPEAACPIDFAYHVHSDIGDHCTGAKVNSRMVPLSFALKNGDVVEILVDKNKKPSRDWLKFVKTSIAGSHIKNYLKKSQPRFSAGEILRRIFQRGKLVQRPSPTLEKIETPQRALSKIKKTAPTIIIGGKGGISYTLAKCCNPKLGDEIRAFVTKNRGASVHRVSCESFIQSEKKWPEKIVEAKWSQK